MFIGYFVFFLGLTAAHNWRQYVIYMGSYTTIVTIDTTLVNPSFILTHIEYETLYVFSVSQGVSSPNILCRTSTTNPIILAPKGCDSYWNENCGENSLAFMMTNWFEDRGTCGRGECLGPPVPLSWLGSVGVLSGLGPACSIPSMTIINTQTADLSIKSNCLINGTYVYDIDRFVYGNSYITIQYNITYGYLGETLVWQSSSVVVGVNGTSTWKSCLVEYEWIGESNNDIMVPPVYDLISTYFKQERSTLYYYRTSACNLRIGRLRFGLPVIPGVLENQVVGGIPLFRTATGIPIKVEGDPLFEDFLDDGCARFYPKEDTFNGFGTNGFNGPVYNRWVDLSCFAPFPFPENILALGTLDERGKQCIMLGGVVSSPTYDLCAMDSWKTYCKKGFIYFDERCWYKFNSVTQSSLQVASGQSSQMVCQQLNPHAEEATLITFSVSAWLQRFYVYWGDTRANTRVVINANRCDCYSGVQGVESCHCQDPNFPLCSYHIKDVPLYWNEFDFHPETLAILRDGQDGVQRPNDELICECFAGSKGETCEKRTCVAPVNESQALNSSSSMLLSFFQNCNVHGFCSDDLDPHICQCNDGYGPSGNLYTGYFILSPCACPTLIKDQLNVFIINGVEYQDYHYAICNGAGSGACVNGYCECTDDYNGESCNCQVPWPLLSDGVVEMLECNGHGTCLRSGCQCEPGWGGISCTSFEPPPIPGTIVNQYNLSVITLSARSLVSRVYTSQGDGVVWISDETVEGRCIPLSWNENEMVWECFQYGYEVYMSGNGVIQYVTEEWYPVCGNHSNVYMARYFATELNRGWGVYKRIQPFELAMFGSTIANCMCGPGFTGSICGIGITSSGTCGDSTVPARGSSLNVEVCQCAEIGDLSFQGEYCECPLINGELCGLYGTCIHPTSPYGKCQWPLDDPLNYPFSYRPLRRQWNGIIMMNDTSQYLCVELEDRIMVDGVFQYSGKGMGILIKECNSSRPMEEKYVIYANMSSTRRLRYDCSSPVDRILDEVTNTSSCKDDMHSNNYGVGFGLFENGVPGMDFDNWNNDTYLFLGSLLNNTLCEPTDEIWDNFVLQWPEWEPREEMIISSNNVVEYDHFVIHLNQALDGIQVIDQGGGMCFSQWNITIGDLEIYCPWVKEVLIMTSPWLPYYNLSVLVMSWEDQILNIKRFPFPACSNIDNPIDYQNESHLELLESYHHVYLAARRCTSDSSCPNVSCVYDMDTTPFVPWRNTMQTIYGGMGDEGGCQCEHPNYDPFTFCTTCISGYGPNTVEEINDAILFFTSTNLSFPDMTKRCMYPSTSGSYRGTVVCEGRGLPVLVNESYPVSTIVRWPLVNIERRCELVIWRGEVYWNLYNDTSSWNLHTYISNQSYINVIHDVIYINNTMVRMESDSCVSGGHGCILESGETLYCQEYKGRDVKVVRDFFTVYSY